MSSDCEMCSDCEMYDPRDYDSNGYSDSEMNNLPELCIESDNESDCETNEVSESEREDEIEYTVTFKIHLKAVSILYSRIDEVIDKLIYDELLKQEDVGITINQL